MDDYNNLIHDLLHELIDGANIKKILDKAEDIIGSPLALNDMAFNIIAYSQNYPKDDISDRINVRKSTPPDERKRFTERCQSIIFDGLPHIVSWSYMRRNQIMCGGYASGKIVGYITIPGVYKPLDEIDCNLVKSIADILATALLINKNSLIRNNSPSNNDLLFSLLSDNYSNLNEMVFWNAFDNINSYRILWFLQYDNMNNILSLEDISNIALTMNKWWQVPYNEGYAVMVDGEDISGINKLNKFSTDYNLLIAASDIFYNFKETRENFFLAKDILTYSRVLGKESGIAYFNNCKVLYLLDKAKSHIDLKKLQSDVIFNISRHDKKNNTEYELTLLTYFSSNMNLYETSKKLHIHKNTVSYRISKISDIFNLDLSDIQTITSLYLSYLIKNKIY